MTLGDLNKLGGIKFSIEKVLPKAGKEGSVNPADYDVDSSYTGTTKTTSSNAADKGQITWDNLPVGIYRITEDEADTRAQGFTPVTPNPFLVSVPMTNPTKDGWIYDINLYLKNATFGLKKEPVYTDFSGTKLGWAITLNIPSDITEEGNGALKFTDVHDTRLAYDTGSVKLVYTNKAGTEATLTETTHYTVSYTAPTLTVNLTKAGLKELREKAFLGAGSSIPQLKLTYTTTIKVGSEGSIVDLKNDVTTEYKNKDGSTFTPGTTGKTNVAAIQIVKYGRTDSGDVLLPGAKFAICDSLANAQSKTPMTNPITNLPWIETTNASGIANFKGLNKGTYFLVETEAPAGYNLLTEIIQVTITEDEVKLATVKTETIVNFKGFTLPVTGGSGTLWFTLIGLALIGVACGVYFVYKRKQRHAS
jgi:LPXTG-motif cell wall-anchored protein